MSRRLSRPADPTFIRLEMDPSAVPAVEKAAYECRLSLASYCRLVVELVSAHGRASVEDVKKEADKRLAKEEKRGKK